MKKILLAALLSLAASPVLAQSDDCRDLKKELEKKMRAERMKELEGKTRDNSGAVHLMIVPAGKVGSDTVVASCEDNKKRIVSRRD